MNRMLLPLLLLVFAACHSTHECQVVDDVAVYADPFIGTGGHGHTFPGATVPFGMMQLSPDTRMNDWDGCSGYHTSDNTIIGFSHTHLSGTGVGDYGDFRFMPIVGEVILDKGVAEDTRTGYRSAFNHENEDAKPGYYSVVLDDYNVKVELAAGERVGMHRYTFPQTEDAHILIDLVEGVDNETVYESFLNVENDSAISGFRRTGDWAKNQYLYFYAEFSKPFKSYSIFNKSGSAIGNHVESDYIKAYFDFDTDENEQIVVRIALSAVDVEGAKNNMKAELADDDFDLDALAQKAYDKWNDEMKRYQVQGGTEMDKIVYYSALYHTMVAPNLFSDADGRFRAHDFQIHQSDRPIYTIFSLWDTFRALHPLFSLTQRERTLDFINTFLSNYETGGVLPVWELAANETYCMIGNHAIPVIVDAYFSGIRDFDVEKALEAMVASARRDAFGLSAYDSYGFISTDQEGEAVSKTLEYAYDDWCIARMAEDMGKTLIANEFYERSQSYKNIYNAENQFFQGRRNGGFIAPFDPAQVNFTLTEANSYQYRFFAPHDINTHIDMMGGSEEYGNRLDGLFNATVGLTGRVQADITGLIGQYAHGNEPSHNTIYMYNFIGRPTTTQKYVNQVMDSFYSDERDGYSGNEDCGQMSAWAIFSAMGIYPATPACGYYVLGVPRFDKVTISLENGKQFRVVAKNLNERNRYVKSVKLNGKPLNRSYVYFDEVFDGGELEFTMTSTSDSKWATRPEECPVMRVPGESIVVVPVVKTESDTFFDSLLVSMSHPVEGAQIYYTLDGTAPTENSILYTGPFYVNETTDLTLAALLDGRWSRPLESHLHYIDAQRVVTVENMYSDQYEAGGSKALIDRLRGGLNFRTGNWQGYHGVDLVATVDLGAPQRLNRVAGSFFQDQDSWIFMPVEVEYFVSDDGNKYVSVGKVRNTLADDEEGGFVQEFEVRPNREARYIKMVAKNRGVCPDWHVGAGLEAWIFCDEIIIE